MFDFKGQTVIVTGASAGIGQQIAIALARQGADVALLARRLNKLEEVAQEIQKLGTKCKPYQCDVSDEKNVIEVIQQIKYDFGKIDILINNAGIFRTNSLFNYTVEDWNAVLDVHLRGTFLCSREASKIMAENRYGRIVNVASIGGVIGRKGQISYYSAKGGVINMTRALAAELAEYGITVNCVSPGLFENESISPETEYAKKEATKIPLGRIGSHGDLDGICIFFASKESGYTTGQNICVDGGTTSIR